jgi:hypothetical protein
MHRVRVGRVMCHGARGVKSLRVIKVNTFEPLLKTLTTRQTLIWRGFQPSKVKLCRRVGEDLRETRVMGFGELGERVRDGT